MSLGETTLTSGPAFYDALTGEFTPASDPSRSHTIGRLLIATFDKGQVRYPEPPILAGGIEYQVREYQPSWAPEVTTSLHSFDTAGQALVKDFILHKGEECSNENRFRICDMALENSLRIVRPGQNEEQIVSLELGDSLIAARIAVTEAVQEFFSV